MTSIDLLLLPTAAPQPQTTRPDSPAARSTQGADAPSDEPAKETEEEAAAPADAFAALLASLVAPPPPPPEPVLAASGAPVPAIAEGAAPVLAVMALVAAPVEVPVVEPVAAELALAPAALVTAEAAPVVADAAPAVDLEPVEAEPETIDLVELTETDDAPVLELPTSEDAPAPVEEAPVVTAAAAPLPKQDQGAELPPGVTVNAVSAPAAPAADPIAAPTPAAPAPPAPPAPPAQSQIVSHVSHLLQAPDGEYRVGVRLHPEELGAVQVDIRLRGGEISLHMRAETEAGQQAIRSNLAGLRAELEAAGVAAGTLDLGAWNEGRQETHDTPGQRTPNGSSAPAEDLRAAAPEPTDDIDDSVVDVQM